MRATASTRQETTASYPPTADAPEIGLAQFFDVALSEAEYWVDGDDHVIRSREFEVIAGAPDFEYALHEFVSKVIEFSIYLGDLDDPAENEEEMLHLLAPRIARAARQMERLLAVEQKRNDEKPLLVINLPRRRQAREDAREWHPLSKPDGSSVPSLA